MCRESTTKSTFIAGTRARAVLNDGAQSLLRVSRSGLPIRLGHRIKNTNRFARTVQPRRGGRSTRRLPD